MLLVVGSVIAAGIPVWKQANVGAINAGGTAWMLGATALVLLMTRGLSFFYGGMVRPKNVVSTMLQSTICMRDALEPCRRGRDVLLRDSVGVTQSIRVP